MHLGIVRKSNMKNLKEKEKQPVIHESIVTGVISINTLRNPADGARNAALEVKSVRAS